MESSHTSSRSGFTLIELLVIIGIMGLMVTVGIVNVRSGRGSARVKGATRDIFGAIRHARSTALVTGSPAIITYSTEKVDDEIMAKVEITSAKLIDSGVDRSKVQTLSGEPLKGEKMELVHIEEKDSAVAEGDDADGKNSGGETLSDVLFAPVDADIVKGMRIKVLKEDEELPGVETVRKSRVSVFSNVDYLLGRYNKSKDEAKDKAKKPDDEVKADAIGDDLQEPISFVWETNGRVEPHKVWVYADGKKPEDGLLIRIDRFGAAKVLSGDGREE